MEIIILVMFVICNWYVLAKISHELDSKLGNVRIINPFIL